MKSTLSTDELAALKPYENDFRCIIGADYCPQTSQINITKVWEVALLYGWVERHPGDCANCISRLFRFVGLLYFGIADAADPKQALRELDEKNVVIDSANDKAAVELTAQEAKKTRSKQNGKK